MQDFHSCDRGEAKNTYVPQSVLTPEGEVLDIHIVLNEMFKSGDKLFVEYSAGPVAYKARSDFESAMACRVSVSTTSVCHCMTQLVHCMHLSI